MSDAGPLPALRIFKTVHCYPCCPCPGSASCRTKDSLSYKEAGVNIAAGSELVGKIKPLAKATEREGCVSSLGSFAALFDLKRVGYQDPMLVSATDGVGTKLKVCLFFSFLLLVLVLHLLHLAFRGRVGESPQVPACIH